MAEAVELAGNAMKVARPELALEVGAVRDEALDRSYERWAERTEAREIAREEKSRGMEMEP